MELYCDTCNRQTRHIWDDFTNKFVCTRKTVAHGYHYIECETCNPLINGWCNKAMTKNGKMLDEKCPKVSMFVDAVMTK